jgi:hypothetical protein
VLKPDIMFEKYSSHITQMRRYSLTPVITRKESFLSSKPIKYFSGALIILLVLIYFQSYLVGTVVPGQRTAVLNETAIREIIRDIEIDYPYIEPILKHFPASNERRIDLYMPYISNLGGAYLGVGTDQNFTLLAWSGAEYAWLMDVDLVAVYVNRIHLYFFELASSYGDFLSLWKSENRNASFKLIMDRFGKFPDFALYRFAWDIAQKNQAVEKRLKNFELMTDRYGFLSFHNRPADYRHIRELVLKKRIHAVAGNLLGNKTMAAVAVAARKLNIPVRVFYTSNAEDYFSYLQQARNNVLLLPADSKSYIIRTVQKKAWNDPGVDNYPDNVFHYNIQPLHNFQEWMMVQKRFSVFEMLKHREKLSVSGLSIINRPPPVSVVGKHAKL